MTLITRRTVSAALLALAFGLTAAATAQSSRDFISIVGSSTVYPFSTVVAERFGNITQFKVPKIESTGSGGGLKLFCAGVGLSHPDVANSSRRIKASEIEMCEKNGVAEIVEVKIGYDGIVLASSIDAKPLPLTRREIFLALAKRVPAPDGSETLVTNPYTLWSDINPDLPAQEIEILGPPPTSGTRDAFVELAMEGGCKTVGFIKDMKATDKNEFKTICHTVREDGAFIEAGENDNLIVKKLRENPDALGIFGFSFLDQNADIVKGAPIDGVEPTFEQIASGVYPVSRPLYFYVKVAHVGTVPGIREFLDEFTGDNAMGDDGYLAERGLIPLPQGERDAVIATVKDMAPLKLASN